jgi:hypothetical protein
MPVDIFTREQFEAALPRHKDTGVPLWKLDTDPAEEYGTEWEYLVTAPNGLFIRVRSSVSRVTSTSDECGENSIRCWIVGPDQNTPWGSKVGKWVTRMPGWEGRLAIVLRKLYKMAAGCGPCPSCRFTLKGQLKVFITKRGPNKGRVFYACEHRQKDGTGCRYFQWEKENGVWR